jgi:hypothetical protein
MRDIVWSAILAVLFMVSAIIMALLHFDTISIVLAANGISCSMLAMRA